METKTFFKDEVIFNEGEDSSEAYRLLRGEVEISLMTATGSRSLARLASGEIFGEMSLIDDKPRSATAVALTECEVEIISEENFNTRVLNDPDNLQAYIRTLFDRIRSTDALLQWHVHKWATSDHGKAGTDPMHRDAPLYPIIEASDLPLARIHLTSSTSLGSGTDVHVTKLPFRIGRVIQGHSPSPLAPNDLSIADQKPYRVSRNHCVIERIGQTFLVRDLGSSSGTIVNGMPLGMYHDSFVAALKPGENTLVLGGVDGPHQFRIVVQ